jgi:hypothetical protein
MLAHYAAVRKRLWMPKPKPKKPPAFSLPETAGVTVSTTADAILTGTPPHDASIKSLRLMTGFGGTSIIKAVCKVTGVSVRDLRSRSRLRHLVRARFIVYLLCWKLTNVSLVKIGTWMGGRDHSTILHGLGEGARRIDELAADVEAACELLKVPVPDFSDLKERK